MRTNKGGRPPKNDGERKSVRVTIRMTPSEFDALEQRRKHYGLPMSEYLLLNGLAQSTTIRKLDIVAAPATLLNAINRVGTTLFQIWQDHRKSGQPLPRNLEATLDECGIATGFVRNHAR